MIEADNEENDMAIDATSSNVHSGSSSSSSSSSSSNGNRQQVSGRIILSVLDSDRNSHSFDDND